MFSDSGQRLMLRRVKLVYAQSELTAGALSNVDELASVDQLIQQADEEMLKLLEASYEFGFDLLDKTKVRLGF